MLLFILYIILAKVHANNNETLTNNKGLNIDIDYRNDTPIGSANGSFSGELLNNKFPVPFLLIKPNQLENVHQIAESALENESIIAGLNIQILILIDTEDVYERIISNLEQRSPEEMVTDIIAKINKLEALKAELGTEERIARLKLSGKNSTYSNSVPVSHPVEVNPNNYQ